MTRSTGSALVALVFACLPVSAWAQTMPTAVDDETRESDQIVVTGTRERARTQYDTMAPVDVLSSAAIQSSVSGDLSDTLAQLLPSFNVDIGSRSQAACSPKRGGFSQCAENSRLTVCGTFGQPGVIAPASSQT